MEATPYYDMTKDQYQAFMEMKTDGPLQMLNLLKFKDKVESSGLSGSDHYNNYMKAIIPFFQNANAKVRFMGKPKFTLIGPSEKEWDKVLIVEYAQKEDFVKMITTPGYPAKMRREALADSRLIFCELMPR